jgi:hypothetical protein
MKAQVARGRVSRFDSLVLENDRVRAVIIPSLGGRVWELWDVLRQRQWIWHRHDVPLEVSPRESNYDDRWAGGWEELFPNDAAGEFEGRHLPDHGIWWTTAWTVDALTNGPDGATVRLVADTMAPDTSCVKEFRLDDDSDTITASYRIVSRESKPFHFLFKQHFPIALTPDCRLALPDGLVTTVDPSFGTLVSGAPPFAWPTVDLPSGKHVDLRTVPGPSHREREFVYVSGLREGWCGVDDPRAGASLRMLHETSKLPFVWLFLTYGGWRDCFTAVLEPCTNMPKDLAAAVRLGQAARLPAGGTFETRAAVTLGGLEDAKAE